MLWGEESHLPTLRDDDLLQDVVGFLQRRLGHGPALLWTEDDGPDGAEPPPAPDAHRRSRHTAALAAALHERLGRLVEPAAVGGAGALTGRSASSLLLFQRRGAGRVQPTGPGGRFGPDRADGSPQTVRLRPGQWLLLPPGCGYRLQCRPGAEPLVLRIPLTAGNGTARPDTPGPAG
ncbi:hypothetical protein [Kitasatospora sp. NPDC051705]|uniref:hypothetical protein n=1 Tax=Kitasatospora sp. NPDC051705 TaxID=3364057 RepID=UPI0037975492